MTYSACVLLKVLAASELDNAITSLEKIELMLSGSYQGEAKIPMTAYVSSLKAHVNRMYLNYNIAASYVYQVFDEIGKKDEALSLWLNAR